MPELVPAPELRPVERLDWWRHQLSTVLLPYDVVAEPDAFDVALRVGRLGAVQVSDVVAGGQVATRSWRTIARSEDDFYTLGLQSDGSCLVSQDGREAQLRPGELAICDTTRPLTLAFASSFRMIAVQFPRELIRLPPQVMAQVTARRIRMDRGVGAVVAPFLLALAAQLDTIPAASAPGLADTTLDLVSMLAGALAQATPDTPPELRRGLMLQIKTYVERHLRDPRLDPAGLAQAHHISVRHLYALFEAEGTSVARYIRGRRLEGCRRDLAESHRCQVPVAVVAARWGFLSPPHFSRLFKSAYGESPTAFRRRSAATPG